jgi:hypothetical protein
MRALPEDPLPPGFERSVAALVAAACAGDRGAVLRFLSELVPGFAAERGGARR